MRVTFIASLLFAAAALSLAARAAGPQNDLANCRFHNGLPMHPKECVALRKIAAEDAARKERDRVQLEAARQREADRQAAEAERKERVAEELRVRREQEAEQRAARQKHFEAEEAAQARVEAAAAKASAEREAALKAACGADYKALRVGMSIERAKECVAPFKLTGQLNRVDGIVSTYQYRGAYAHVMQGRIVSWGK